jgi:hypothetical protein
MRIVDDFRVTRVTEEMREVHLLLPTPRQRIIEMPQAGNASDFPVGMFFVETFDGKQHAAKFMVSPFNPADYIIEIADRSRQKKAGSSSSN